MDHVELLTAIIEASIALIGFSGVVVALGPRSSGEWFTGDRLRLTNLLGLGFILLACTVVGLIFVSAGLAQVWTLSSLAWLLLVLPFAGWSIRRTYQLRREPRSPRSEPVRRWTPYYFRVALGVVLATAGLQAANAALLAEFWAFFVGLAVLLLLGVTQFIRLLWFGLFESQGAAQAAEIDRP